MQVQCSGRIQYIRWYSDLRLETHEKIRYLKAYYSELLFMVLYDVQVLYWSMT